MIHGIVDPKKASHLEGETKWPYGNICDQDGGIGVIGHVKVSGEAKHGNEVQWSLSETKFSLVSGSS